MNRFQREERPFTIRTRLRERVGPPDGPRGRFDGEGARESDRGSVAANTLFAQTLVCGCLLLLCLTIFSGSSSMALQVRAWYHQAVSKPAVNVREVFSQQKLEDLRQLLGTAVPVMAPVGEPPQPAYRGQGGWWPFSGAEGETLPAVPTGASMGVAVLSALGRYPVYGQVTCGYGWRVHPITGEQDFHSGVDIGAPEGASIYTAYPGKVTKRGSSSIYGNFIEITHSDSVKTVYCHCSKLLAPEGANLRAGERVALVGSTGISTGPHLHFEVLVDNVTFSPLPQLGLG